MELYAHDFSEFHRLELSADGRFGYPALPLYWAEAGRRAFFIKVNGKLAGLIFVKQGSEVTGDASVQDIAEFFVMRGYRTQGIGKEAARQIWERFPNKWEVRVMRANVGATRFWKRAIAEYLGEERMPTPFVKRAEHWLLFAFESLRPDAPS